MINIYQGLYSPSLLVTLRRATWLLSSLVCVNGQSVLASPQSVSVMSYNIQQLGLSNWLSNHFEKQRLELIPEAILALPRPPDVLILQEVFTEYAFTFLVDRLIAAYPHHTQIAGEDCNDPRWTTSSGNCKANFFKGNSGVLIFSRWPINQQHAYVFDAGRMSKSFDFLARKGVVYAKIQTEWDNSAVAFDSTESIALSEPLVLHVFGTHLQASVEEHDIRLLQLDEMRVFIDSFAISSDEPVILGGDFNISSNDQAGFNDLLVHSVASVTLPTLGVGSISDSTNGYRRLLAGASAETVPDETLDYVLLRTDHRPTTKPPSLQVINLKSSAPWLGNRLVKPDVELTDLSDHYPVLVEFEF